MREKYINFLAILLLILFPVSLFGYGVQVHNCNKSGRYDVNIFFYGVDPISFKNESCCCQDFGNRTKKTRNCCQNKQTEHKCLLSESIGVNKSKQNISSFNNQFQCCEFKIYVLSLKTIFHSKNVQQNNFVNLNFLDFAPIENVHFLLGAKNISTVFLIIYPIKELIFKIINSTESTTST